ncbi:MAG TPA: penicillin acylase family protein, partial [Jiangellaceae bacterium]|nr:penicillin acylase family protein [Jiangellaceae bacterium]
IDVRAGDAVTEELKFTRHGPVIYEDPERNVAFAVRTAWSAPGTGAYFGSVEYMRAGNWREFLGAMNRWGAPGENQQYADVDGNIGWKPGGKAPVRENWDGLMPVPGDGEYEWDSFYDMDQLPVNFNPERGWLQTNNEMRLFDDFENGPQQEYVERKIGFEAVQTFRAIRTRELLAEEDGATQESMNELWQDRLSVPARSIIAELGDITTDDEEVQQAIELLQNWDYQMDNDSAAAALFDVWTDLHGAPGTGEGFLGQAMVDAAVDDEEAAERIGVPHETVLVEMIADPQDWLTGNVVANRDQAILTSLRQAIDKVTEDQGGNPGQWRYGEYNQQELRHAFSDLVDFRTRRQIDIGPEERFVVNNTIADEGASWRYIAEPGNWDDAMAMNNPGQSGDPESPFYDNLFAPWTEGDTFPLHYSEDAIEENTQLAIELRPR